MIITGLIWCSSHAFINYQVAEAMSQLESSGPDRMPDGDKVRYFASPSPSSWRPRGKIYVYAKIRPSKRHWSLLTPKYTLCNVDKDWIPQTSGTRKIVRTWIGEESRIVTKRLLPSGHLYSWLVTKGMSFWVLLPSSRRQHKKSF